MLLSPLQNTARFGLEWTQVRPRLTQAFGERPWYYSKYGMDGHNGLDFGPNGDENIFAPMSGYVKLGNSGSVGYGLHIKIRDSKKEVVLAHLSKVFVNDGAYVHVGDKIAVMGNTGDSSAKHLHLTLKYLIPTGGDRWQWEVKDYDNGYFGGVDPKPYLITWKGSQSINTLT